MKLYFTITGTSHYHGQAFFLPAMPVLLEKEPDNPVDREAIMVKLEGLGKVGYVANSPYTVLGESCSAGRLYDKIGPTAMGRVLYVLPKGVLCCLTDESPTQEPIADPAEDSTPAEETPTTAD